MRSKNYIEGKLSREGTFMCTASRRASSPPITEQQFWLFKHLTPDPFAIFVALRDGHGRIVDFLFEYANPAAVKASGQLELMGHRLLEVFPRNAKSEDLFPRYVRLLDEQGADEVEVEYHEGLLDGWYRNLAVALDKDRLGVSWRDITIRKNMEAQLRDVAKEYRHRLRNAFTIMGALTRQCLKSATSKEELADKITDRLFVLSRAQDLLVEEEGVGDLGSIIGRSLEPFKSSKMRIGPGPDVRIPQQAVVALCLALNELATNALKYGGLSQPGGEARVTWHLEGERLELHWDELAPQSISSPVREGFGSKLINDLKVRLKGGEVTRNYRPHGLHVTIAFLLSPDGD